MSQLDRLVDEVYASISESEPPKKLHVDITIVVEIEIPLVADGLLKK